MNKKSVVPKGVDDLREEYDLAQLKHGIRGKYYRQATAGTNLVLIEPDLMDIFPNGEAVNRPSAFSPRPPVPRVLPNVGGLVRLHARDSVPACRQQIPRAEPTSFNRPVRIDG